MTSNYNMNIPIPADIFRAYDIRGTMGDAITENFAYLLGLALGTEAQLASHRKMLVARDGRLSSPGLIKAITQGINDSGCDVIDIGLVPTAVLYFATYHLNTPCGVMITGSHNPSNYNGFKIMIDGKTLSEARIQDLYRRITQKEFKTGKGSITEKNVDQAYLDRITADVKLEKPLKIVIDCGNGATGNLAPLLFKALGCEVIELFCKIDGRFPNHHPDPSIPENLEDLIDAVKEHNADAGLAFDGDGDRVGAITNTGEIIWPDRQLMLYAIDILEKRPGAEIIYDIKCSRHVRTVVEKHGGKATLWKTGHSVVKQKLYDSGAALAGELSGHIFFHDRWYGFDDGLYVGARLLEIISKQSGSFNDLCAKIPDSVNTPELKIAIAENEKFSFIETLAKKSQFEKAEVITLDGLRVEFTNGWGLIRASNTTPCLVVRFEADTEVELKRIQSIFQREIQKIRTDLILPW